MYQIFISYRRDGGESLAYLLRERLAHDGYSVFLDVEALRSGMFNQALYQVIDECTDFLLILPEHALDRCSDPNDWLRLEIERALARKKNIIPVLLRNFTFPKMLPASIQAIRNYNGLTANFEYFDASMEKLETKLLQSVAGQQATAEPQLVTKSQAAKQTQPATAKKQTAAKSQIAKVTTLQETTTSQPGIKQGTVATSPEVESRLRAWLNTFDCSNEAYREAWVQELREHYCRFEALAKDIESDIDVDTYIDNIARTDRAYISDGLKRGYVVDWEGKKKMLPGAKPLTVDDEIRVWLNTFDCSNEAYKKAWAWEIRKNYNETLRLDKENSKKGHVEPTGYSIEEHLKFLNDSVREEIENALKKGEVFDLRTGQRRKAE